jgi:hypothetical protein
MSRTASTGKASSSSTACTASPPISRKGVDATGNKDEGAGDQGIMFGYATDETPDLMPATLYYSHKILERMAADRHSGAAPFLEPDAKSQVTLRYEGSLPVAATAVVVSTQHAPGYDEGDKEAELHAYVKRVVAEVIPPVLLRETEYHINPTGSFEIGGPDGDAGPDGPQDHRRHLWRRGPAWRRRVFGQGPDQGRPLGRLYHALSRQEHRRGGPGHALHDPAGLCHRRVEAAVALCRYARHRHRG